MEIKEIKQQHLLIEQQIVLKEFDLVEIKKKASYLQGFLEGYKQSKEKEVDKKEKEEE